MGPRAIMSKPITKLVAGLFGVTLIKDRARRSKPLTTKPIYIDMSSFSIDPEQYGYTVYARDVACPLSDVEPGAVVVCEYDGHPAKWLNGTIYIRSNRLDKKQHQIKGTRRRSNARS